MAKSVLELAVGTGQWDAGLKKAKSALDNFVQSNGGLSQALDKESQKMQQFVKMMGGMESSAKTAKGQMNDYKGTIEQLTMQYNRMTDAQKQAVGPDYMQAIDQLREKYQGVNEEIQEINRSLSNVKAPDINAGGDMLGGIGSKIDGALAVFGGNLMTKGFETATNAAMTFVSAIKDAAAQGLEMAKQGEGIRIAFGRLNQPDLLDELNNATHNTVTNLELMKQAVKFNDFNLPLSQMGTLLAFAQQKAKDTGQSVDYMVDSIVTGLGRQSLMILDNLGLSAAEIRERMKETGDMTTAVADIIRDRMKDAGDYVETAADRAAQADKKLKDAMEELGCQRSHPCAIGTERYHRRYIRYHYRQQRVGLLHHGAVDRNIQSSRGNPCTWAVMDSYQSYSRGRNQRSRRCSHWRCTARHSNRKSQGKTKGEG